MSMITCPECGKRVSDQAQCCIGCGSPIIPTIKCSYCGIDNDGKSPACTNCGAPISARQNNQPQYQQPQRALYQPVQSQYQQPQQAPYQPYQPYSPPVYAAVPYANTNQNIINMQSGRQKDKGVALLLCAFLGIFGGHKFYEGKIGTGVIYLFTFGLFGIGVIIDFIVLLFSPNPYYV